MGVEVTGVWLRGGRNSVEVLVEVSGSWRRIMLEHMPLHGNDGDVWPISHIVEESGIKYAPPLREV